MAIKLKNEHLSVKIETAGEKYSGSRFDWNGTVTSIKFDGIQLLGEEKPFGQRDDSIYGRGLHNEFGIRQCIGYDEAGDDGRFPKIGTGWLKKDEKPYFFYTQYDVERISFKHEEVGKTKTICSCSSGVKNGYGYNYTKTFSLDGTFLVVEYKLENTGSKTISTNEYVHNFFLPGGGRLKKRAIDEDISLNLGWGFNTGNLAENVRTDGVLLISASGCAKEDKPEILATGIELKQVAKIQVLKTPVQEFFLGGVWQARMPQYAGSGSTVAHWTLSDRKTGVQISEIDNFTPDACDLWGYRGAICPEVFFAFTLEPGDIVSWKRIYSFAR